MTKKCNQTVDAFGRRLETKQIKAILKSKGWSQKQLAERWNYTETWVSQLINNPERGALYDDAIQGLHQQ